MCYSVHSLQQCVVYIIFMAIPISCIMNILNSSSAAVMVDKFTAEFGIYIYIYTRGLHNCGLEDSRLAAKF